MSLSTNNDIEDFKLNKLIEIPKVEKNQNNDVAKLFKKLKTNIQFLNVNNKNPKTIYITSSYKNEGKSFITSNLAISYTEIGKKVLIIDSDLRKGKQAQIFNIPNDLGFSNLLSGLDDEGKEIDDNINKFIKETGINDLFIITSGTIPPNPTELMTSPKIPKVFKQLIKFFDVIIIDGTSTLATDEALILSRIAGSTILVSDFDNTSKNEFLQAKEDIENVGGNIIGVVINKVYFKEKVSFIKKIFNSIKSGFNNIIIYIKNVFNSKKTKLLEPGRFDENYNKRDIVFVKNLDNSVNSEKIIDNEIEKDENTKKINERKIIEINNSKKNDNDLNTIEKSEPQKDEIKTENIENKIINYESIQNDSITISEEKETKNTETNIVENIKPAIILKTIRNKFNSGKENNKSKKNESNEVITESIPYEEDDNQEYSNVLIDDNVNIDDDTTVVIVDAEKGMGIAFNRNCYAEKLIRGFDKSDGFLKEHYSLTHKNKRIRGFMNIYNITKKQASRIDPLIYATLSELDENIWLQEKKEENLTDTYVQFITKDYDRMPNESFRKYNNRCKSSRYEELKLMGIEINYKTDSKNTSKNINLIDKIEMIKYSKHIKEVKETDINKESQNHNDNKKNLKKTRIGLVHNYSNKEKQIDIKEERKKEIEVLKKVRKERNEVKRKKLRDEREKKNKEKRLLREESRKQRELERIKQREEARIEEELLEDNLYPKTKNNKYL